MAIILKRTPEKIIERGYYRTEEGMITRIPKSLRNPTLRRLCHLNFYFRFREGTPDLINEPAKSVKFIMKRLGYTSRTAYDYYNALIHINFFPDALHNEMGKNLGEIFKKLEEEGKDFTEILKQKQSPPPNNAPSDTLQSANRPHNTHQHSNR